MVRLLTVAVFLIGLTNCSDLQVDSATLPKAKAHAAQPLVLDFRSPAEGEARCRFVIHPDYLNMGPKTPMPEEQWTTHVDGPCRYHYLPGIADIPDDSGTLILTEMGPPTRLDTAGDIENAYFVYLNFRDSGFMSADGSWNADRAATHAHAPLGSDPDNPIRRDGICWANDRARICLER